MLIVVIRRGEEGRGGEMRRKEGVCTCVEGKGGEERGREERGGEGREEEMRGEEGYIQCMWCGVVKESIAAGHAVFLIDYPWMPWRMKR
jgi:hypothetical protein